MNDVKKSTLGIRAMTSIPPLAKGGHRIETADALKAVREGKSIGDLDAHSAAQLFDSIFKPKG